MGSDSYVSRQGVSLFIPGNRLGQYLRSLESVHVEEKKDPGTGILRNTQRYESRSNFTGLKVFPGSSIVPSVMKYYLREPLSAVLKEQRDSIAFLTIDACSIIAVKGAVGEYGFVEANYAGDDVLVFMPDLELRADRLTETAV